MNFHFSLTTLPLQFHESVQDTILLIASGIQDCGHGVTIDNEKVKITLHDSNSSAILEDPGADQFLYVVMPMKL